MLMLITTVAVGIVIAVFATQNTESIPLDFGGSTIQNVPVYLIALIPLIVGLAIAFFIHTAKELSQSLTISELKDENKNLEEELAEVTKRAHKLEIDNAKLKTELGEPEDENSI
jgi:uncharacterized integral membrane protein